MSTPNDTRDDLELRAALRRAAREQAGPTTGLEEAVLTQWQAAQQPAWQAGAALAGIAGGRQLRAWWWSSSGALMLASALLITLWWAHRPDPALEELMQLDLLSQIAIGEM